MLLLFAFLIGFFSLWYTNNLVQKLELQEREKIATWADAVIEITSLEVDGNVNFSYEIIQSNTTIPVILTDGEGHVIDSRNLDDSRLSDSSWAISKINEMKEQNEPLEYEYEGGGKSILYYENSTLLNQLRIYPYFQLGVIALFLVISYFAFSYSRTSEQNKVWAGMSKETAHQLGTPISSLLAWLEYIKINEGKISQKVIGEMEHDLNRLHLITDRFSKIGSEPSLQVENLYEVLEDSVSYIDSRTSKKVDITIESPEVLNQINILVNRPLFAWVIENLCKNAVDAMNGEGKITFRFISEKIDEVVIEVEDTGKGMPSNRFKTIFKPGYTTKKRGWGLGLSLVKRIVENYHNGKIYVKSSVIGAGTKFRIELPRANENATT